MIEFERLSFWYPDAVRPALDDVSASVPEGELALVVGLTGSGKSTLLRAVNGLVPRFTGGHLEGRVLADGLDPRTYPPRELAGVVGVVGQDPLAGFVTDVVEDELAYGMEQLAVPPSMMRRRVEETLDLMGIADLRRRSLRSLSGGQQQRVAIGAVLAMHPSILVLDEPTSALDPAAAEEVLAAVVRLVHDVGLTVLAAEHRLERVVEYADRLLVLDDGTVRDGPPQRMLVDAPIAPPVVELARWAGWSPLPLSVRDARRRAVGLRRELVGHQPTPASAATGDPAQGLVARGVVVRYRDDAVVRGVDLAAAPGEIVALMGRNGSGKSSLLWAVHGAGRRSGGWVRIAGRDPASVPRGEVGRLVGLTPQQAPDLLYLDSVRAECGAADAAAGAADGSTRALLDRMVGLGEIAEDAHPRDLSEGQRLALVLAVQLVAKPRVILLDEPTRGLDYRAKSRLRSLLSDLAVAGSAIVVATHDVEFVAQVARRVVVLATGEVVTDAPTRDALSASPVFAPQVAKVLSPEPWTTVDQVRAALPLPSPEGWSLHSAARPLDGAPS
jgi:energy-coupling factor transport system ATP-binding protein